MKTQNLSLVHTEWSSSSINLLLRSSMSLQPEASDIPEHLTAYHLNWCNQQELLGNQSLFSSSQRLLFTWLERKQRDFSYGFDHGPYFSNAYALIAADDPKAEKLVCCGKEVRKRSAPCDLWIYCSRCAYARQCNAWGTYIEAFQGRNFYFLTLAYKGDISFDATNNTRIYHYWAATDQAVKSLFSTGAILGAYWVNELAVRDYQPLRVQPHTHAIVHANYFTQEMVDQCCPAMSGYRSEDFNGPDLKPDIMVKPVPTKRDFYNLLRYCTKSLDLSVAYDQAFIRLANTDRSRIPLLNREFKNFVEEYRGVIQGYTKIHTCGTMMPQRRDFIGTSKSERAEVLDRLFEEREEWSSESSQ